MTPEQQANIGEIAAFTKRLREYGKKLEGDGFGKVGDLKAAVKRTCVRLEEVIALIEVIPPEKAQPEAVRGNPDCLGVGLDNVSGCQCRLVFSTISK